MRPESVGLVEVGGKDRDGNRGRGWDRGSQVARVGETEPFLRATSRSPDGGARDVCEVNAAPRRRPDILSVFRSTMVPWRDDKPEPTVAVKSVADDMDDADDSKKGDDIQRTRHKPRLLTWHTYLLALALV